MVDENYVNFVILENFVISAFKDERFSSFVGDSVDVANVFET